MLRQVLILGACLDTASFATRAAVEDILKRAETKGSGDDWTQAKAAVGVDEARA